jgi:hypothetical protein
MTHHHIPEDLNLTLIAMCIVFVVQEEHSFGIRLSCLVLSFFIKHFHRFGPLQLGSCKYELILLLLG